MASFKNLSCGTRAHLELASLIKSVNENLEEKKEAKKEEEDKKKPPVKTTDIRIKEVIPKEILDEVDALKKENAKLKEPKPGEPISERPFLAPLLFGNF